MSFPRLAMSRLFKGKACYYGTLVLRDWVLVRKPVYQVTKRSFVAAYILYFLVHV